jgi:hypothetical protein
MPKISFWEIALQKPVPVYFQDENMRKKYFLNI